LTARRRDEESGTARADALGRDEPVAGAAALGPRVARLRPAVVAILRISAYHRSQFGSPRVTLGPQPESPGVERGGWFRTFVDRPS
jgi:hypothetical protein